MLRNTICNPVDYTMTVIIFKSSTFYQRYVHMNQLLYHYIDSMQMFHTSFNRLIFTKVWMVASLHTSLKQLSILADLDKVVPRMVSIVLLFSSPVSFSDLRGQF